MAVTKAIIPVAGWGVRRLPVTKSIEKCMLPLLNRPVVDYSVMACVEASITDIYFVVNGGAQQLRSYYEPKPQLETYLTRTEDTAALQSIQPPVGVNFHYIEQNIEDAQYGTTVPVWLCRDYIDSDEQFLVVNGDQHIYRKDGGNEVADLIEKVSATYASGGIVGVPIPLEKQQYYGLLELYENGTLRGINEHPGPNDSVSDLKNPGVYLLRGDFMTLVEKQLSGAPNQQGEYYITDLINEFASDNIITVSRASGEYFDCGSLESWVVANNRLLELTTQQY